MARIEAKLAELGLTLPQPLQMPQNIRMSLPFAWIRVRGARAFVSVCAGAPVFTLVSDSFPGAPSGCLGGRLFNDSAISMRHYAFLISEDEFDQVFSRIRDWLMYWADPGKQRAGEPIGTTMCRRVYFDDPDGQLLEVMTRPYKIGA